jgi:hypothetical protein
LAVFVNAELVAPVVIVVLTISQLAGSEKHARLDGTNVPNEPLSKDWLIASSSLLFLAR